MKVDLASHWFKGLLPLTRLQNFFKLILYSWFIFIFKHKMTEIKDKYTEIHKV